MTKLLVFVACTVQFFSHFFFYITAFTHTHLYAFEEIDIKKKISESNQSF